MAQQAAKKLTFSEQLAAVLGTGAVITTAGEEIAARSSDWWPVIAKSRQQGKTPYPADVIVMPLSAAAVVETVNFAQAAGIPLTARGLGSSVVGGPLPVKGGIVLDLTRMNRVLNVNRTDMLVTVEAGKHGGELEDELGKQGLTLGHSPQSLYRSTVGGWVATRATGQLSSKFGGIEDLVVGFKAVTADGRTIDFAPHARMAVGPDLRHLVIGSEGCLFVITEVTIKCFPKPEAEFVETVTFPDLKTGLAAMRELMQARLRPSLLRFYDVAEARHAMKDPAFPLPVMFLGTEGVRGVAKAELDALVVLCARHGGKVIGPKGVEGWLGRRYDFSAIEKILARPDGIAETIEVSNHWSKIDATYAELTRRLAPFADEVLGHFSHAYTDGISLYVILLGHSADAAGGEQKLREIWKVANAAALETGATLSHHHGSGLARSASVPQALGSTWPVLQALKKTFDPKGILNPGKLGFE